MSGTLGFICYYRLMRSECLCVCLQGLQGHGLLRGTHSPAQLSQDLPEGVPAGASSSRGWLLHAYIPISVWSQACSAQNDPVSQHTDL